jgi:hypothetical protein
LTAPEPIGLGICNQVSPSSVDVIQSENVTAHIFAPSYIMPPGLDMFTAGGPGNTGSCLSAYDTRSGVVANLCTAVLDADDPTHVVPLSAMAVMKGNTACGLDAQLFPSTEVQTIFGLLEFGAANTPEYWLYVT